jgi:hypothetical protein
LDAERGRIPTTCILTPLGFAAMQSEIGVTPQRRNEKPTRTKRNDNDEKEHHEDGHGKG